MEGKVTVVGRTKILRARAGEITLPKIVGFAFGSGGSNGSTVLSPVSYTHLTLPTTERV